MTDLELFLSISNKIWHNSVYLIRKFGKNDLNALYLENKIEVRNGLNNKVVRYESTKNEKSESREGSHKGNR